MKAGKCSLVVSGVVAIVSCKASVVYPDAPKLLDAEKSWCEALAKFAAPNDQTWRHRAQCEAAKPTGSAPFIAFVAECYRRHHEEHGENALDLGAVVGRCADDAIAGANVTDIANTEPARAYCGRMTRCSQVPTEGCQAALEQLDGSNKAAFSSAYNLEAQHEIAECLTNSDCSKDEDAASAACFDAAKAKRIWMPPL